MYKTLTLFFTFSLIATEIIPSNRRYTWQGNVGIQGGIPNSDLMTIYTNYTSSATRADVQSGINNCPSNQVVHLAAGTYTWTGDFDYQPAGDGKVLKGDTNANGVPTTIINFTDDSTILVRYQFCDTCMSNEVNLTSDGVKGDTTINVTATPSWAAIGEIIGIDQLDDTNISFNPGQESGTGYRQIVTGEHRGMGQLLKVTATNATQISFEMPLTYTFGTNFTAQIFKSGNDLSAGKPKRKRIGIENIQWNQTGPGTSANNLFKFENAQECWLKNVWSTNFSGGVYLLSYFSYRCEVRHCNFQECKHDDSGQGYGVALYYWGTGWLVEDNIFGGLHVSMQNNFGSCGNVFAYNYEKTGHSRSGQNPGFNAHGTTGFMTLAEGNYMQDKVNGDFVHGSGALYTIFRNRVIGYNTNNVSTNAAGDMSAISVEQYERQWNIVGNTFGLAGWHDRFSTGYGGTGYDTNDCDNLEKFIWKQGYFNNFGCTTNSGDSNIISSPLYSVNWDTVNNGIVAGGFTTNDLVNSYYLASKPTFFGVLPWPPFQPDSSVTNLNAYTNIPAGYRDFFGTEVPMSTPSYGLTGSKTLRGSKTTR